MCSPVAPPEPGAYTFVLKVDDSGHPPHSATKQFYPSVSTSLLLDWLESPKVRDNRIDGSVQVSNGSHDTYDLTVIIVAVADSDQRATAIGYERFDLKPGTNNLPITFGKALPHGNYTIHADAIAEIPIATSSYVSACKARSRCRSRRGHDHAK